MLDVNDNPPVFGQPVYNFTVDENAYNRVVGRITATDKDTDGETLYRAVSDSGPFLIGSNDGTTDYNCTVITTFRIGRVSYLVLVTFALVTPFTK